MSKKVEKAAAFMEQIAADDTHGYAQDKRYGPDYDCSSLVAAALIEAGFKVTKTATTRTLYNQLKSNGFVLVQDGTIKRGDIFLTPDKHVCMAVSPTEVAEARINEKGTTKNGQPGDQTGTEICVRKFYTPSYGWKYHMRHKDVVSILTTPVAKAWSGAYKGKYTTTDPTGQNIRLKADDTSAIIGTIAMGQNATCYGYYTVDQKGRVWLLCKVGAITGFLFLPLLRRN